MRVILIKSLQLVGDKILMGSDVPILFLKKGINVNAINVTYGMYYTVY